ncbi:MAG: DUF3592 domain-containing protein [Candidatus Electrothrix sp. ATG1]|nr:DUF3592 domain-containing protein [Candidatus Electrothrix sp. ATG1]
MDKYALQRFMRRFLENAKKVIAIILVSGTLTGIGLGALVIGVKDIVNANSSKGWPTVSGTVIRSKVLVSEQTTSRSNQTSQTDDYFSPDVAYSYVVDGNTLKNDNIRYGLATNKSAAEKIVQQYPKGGEVEIYYNPSDPVESVLQPGYVGGLLFYPIMGVVAMLAGVFSWWFIKGIE